MSNEDADLIAVQKVADEHINPLIAAHGGSVMIHDIQNGVVTIAMKGGCQGCAMAKRTMNDFVLKVLQTHIPCIIGVKDITSHEFGSNPYFKRGV